LYYFLVINYIWSTAEDKKWKEDEINAYLVYFPEEDYEYTIPRGCLKLFSKEE